MSKSNFDFTVKFFHPPQRTVPCHNFLLNTRTKHTVAQDRLVVAEQRTLEAERRKSEANVQLISFEQKQIEKRLISLQHQVNPMTIDGSFKLPIRSASELVLSRPRRQVLWSDHLPISRGKTSINLNVNSSNQNLLALPAVQRFERQSSTYSDGDASDLSSFTNDGDSSEETDFETIRRNSFQESIEKMRNVIYRRPHSTHLPVLSTSDEPSKLLPPIVAVIPPED